jgi:chromosome segregation ATPase
VLALLDGRITLRDFEQQSSAFVGQRVNLLASFFSPSTDSTKTGGGGGSDEQLVSQLRQELVSCRSTIEQLEAKIDTCEKSQRLATEVELEYEDLLTFLSDQLNQVKIDDSNQVKQLRTNDQLIKKLFDYLSHYVNKPTDEHVLGQLKYEYEQQQKLVSSAFQHSPYTTKVSTARKS